MTTKPAKDTIYLEADDEITVIIDRVVSAKSKVVALVLPKRASVFQSAVNMKLLKKSADHAKKHLVLISSEQSINAIASVAGVYIARSLTSKPEIPSTPKRSYGTTTIAAEELEPTTLNTSKQVESATTEIPETIASQKTVKSIEEDVITMDASEPTDDKKADSAADETKSEKPKRAKRALKIPDFTSFRTKLTIACLLVAFLIGGWVYGFVIAPRAVVTISVNTSRTSVSYQFTASAAAESLDAEKRVVPAKVAEVTKESNAKVPATGQKNVGKKASGTVAVTNCSAATYNIAAGDVFTSGGVSFVAVEGTSIPKSSYSFTVSGFECDKNGQDTVTVEASNPGAVANLGAGNYSISGSPTNVTAKGSAMSGGTDEVKTVVSADDIKNATAQLKGSTSAEASTDLKAQLEDEGLMVLDQTLEEGEPIVKNSPAEGAEASELTVTQTVVYKMVGVKADDLKSILNAQLGKQLETQQNTKSIRDDGFSSSTLRVINKVSTGEQIVELQTVATLGDTFNVAAIAQQAAGKPRGEIQKMLENRESVQSVDVSYSPAWVTTTPKKADKISIEIKENEQ